MFTSLIKGHVVMIGVKRFVSLNAHFHFPSVEAYLIVAFRERNLYQDHQAFGFTRAGSDYVSVFDIVFNTVVILA